MQLISKQINAEMVPQSLILLSQKLVYTERAQIPKLQQ